jgi:hypothetical protein
MPTTLHTSLKKIPQHCKLWLKHADAKNELEDLTESLTNLLKVSGNLEVKTYNRVRWLGGYFGMAACDAFASNDLENLSKFLPWFVGFNSLYFRWNGMYSELRQDLGNWPEEFKDSITVAGPAMLSQWEKARICSVRLIEMVEKDQRVNTGRGSRRIKQGTSDAFLIYLLSSAFEIETSFTPAKPLISVYQTLLDGWRTAEEGRFKLAMQSAAEFHIQRSRDDTNKNKYEFTRVFDQIFPAELLVIQALRRRDGLPAFETGHALIDTPWSVIKELPEVEPHPLAVAVEARLKKDYPTFR